MSLSSSNKELRCLRNRSQYINLNKSDLNNLKASITVYDLNCGIGGTPEGFRDMGLPVAVAVEQDKTSIELWKVKPNFDVTEIIRKGTVGKHL